MTLTLEIQPDLEWQLRQEAAREGLDTAGYVLRLLSERLRRRPAPKQTHLDPKQANLLLKINEGLPETSWQRYQTLIERRRAETLTNEEHAELLALSDTIEEAHARRVGYLSELARLRATSLDALIEELGIRLPSHA